jgi:hypothetical protein
MRIVASIFSFPHEIDELEILINNLRNASYHLSNNTEIVLDITVCLSNKITDWNKSSIPRQYFEDKILKLSAHIDWCPKYVKASNTILGELSHRRNSLEEFTDADYFIWINPNIVFPEKTLFYLEQSINEASKITNNHIVTPEMVKMWDTNWDILVNEKFKDKELMYPNTNNPFKDSNIYGEVEIEQVKNIIPKHPKYKILGGLFTCISGNLIKKIGIPKSFGHHGFDDTFLMWSCEKLTEITDMNIQQFKMKNLVVCENHKYRNNSHYLNNMSIYDRKKEFEKLAESNFMKELEKIN